MSLYNNNQSFTSSANYPRQGTTTGTTGTTGTTTGLPGSTATGTTSYPTHTYPTGTGTTTGYATQTDYAHTHPHTTTAPYGSTTTTTKTEPGMMEKTKEILIEAKDFAVEKAQQVGEKIEEAVHQHRHCKNPSAHHGAHATGNKKTVSTDIGDTNKARDVATGSSHDQYPRDNRTVATKIADKVTGKDTTASASHEQYPHQYPQHDDRNVSEKIADKVRGTETHHQTYPAGQSGTTTAMDSKESKNDYLQQQRGTGMVDTKIHGQAH